MVLVLFKGEYNVRRESKPSSFAPPHIHMHCPRYLGKWKLWKCLLGKPRGPVGVGFGTDRVVPDRCVVVWAGLCVCRAMRLFTIMGMLGEHLAGARTHVGDEQGKETGK